MYTITVRLGFSAAHKLMHYHGKCESLHGHNWTVDVTVRARKLNSAGMVVDFADLKRDTLHLLDTLDHKFLNELKPFRHRKTTSESIAKYIYSQLKGIYKGISKVTVWETPANSASYEFHSRG